MVCGDGRLVSCVYVDKNPKITNDKAKAIYAKCIGLHEDSHHADVNVDCGPGQTTRPGWKPGANPDQAEIRAYNIGINCFKNSIGDCKGDKECIKQIEDAIKSDEEAVKAHKQRLGQQQK